MMRLGSLTTSVFLTALVVSLTPALADGCGGACDFQAKPNLSTPPPAAHHAARRTIRARLNPYNYASARAVPQGHGPWRVAPNDGEVPLGPMTQAMPGPCCAPVPCPCSAPTAYGPPPTMYGPQTASAPAYDDPGLRIDENGWTGGVGVNAEGGGGGGGGGFLDGYGQVHYANGGGVLNGPTYNDYNQSFQSNPSVPGPFVPQRMGGPAPATTTTTTTK